MRRARGRCPRCGEGLVDLSRPCGFCELERKETAVTTLCGTERSGGNQALVDRADAVDTLRCMGYSREQVRLVKELAAEGQSVDDVLQILGEPDTEGVAA